jgi:hypothetical protein
MSASCSELKNLVGNLYIYLPVGTKGPSNPDPRSSLCEATARQIFSDRRGAVSTSMAR